MKTQWAVVGSDGTYNETFMDEDNARCRLQYLNEEWIVRLRSLARVEEERDPYGSNPNRYALAQAEQKIPFQLMSREVSEWTIVD